MKQLMGDDGCAGSIRIKGEMEIHERGDVMKFTASG
jgi:hypothetical protein